jgi:hypothetical protein
MIRSLAMGIAASLIDRLAQNGWLSALLLALPFAFGNAASGAEPGVPPGGPPRSPAAAALELVNATPTDARARLLQPFTDEARSDWHYTPRARSGIPYKEMTPAQRQAANALLRTALSAPGLDKVHAIMALEIALREMEAPSSRRDPENYALAIFGTPAAQGAAWGFRLEGHHISLHFTLQNDGFVSTLPQFLGANPATVPRDIEGGPKKDTRVLAEQEDLARGLMTALEPKARAVALFDTRTYGDIVTRNARSLDPLAPVGVRFADLPAAEQASLLRLISAFASHLRPDLSQRRLESVRAGGLDSVRFGWAGSLERGKPFYYRIQGAKFLIELDNSGGNHIHSVWRDFEGDWGRDVLGEHYKGSGKAHGHSAD